jgi:ubiquinone/menaquinone biosynthesis C-methylase UbiE
MQKEIYGGYYKMNWWRLWRKISSPLSWYVRKRFFNLFMETLKPEPQDLVLDMGITADLVNKADNYFEKLYPYPGKITAIGNENLTSIKDEYPGVELVQADGTDLPFGNGTFDIVFSGSVLEHTGSRERQKKFISEALRVGKKIFLTVPDSHFPVELHSGLPFFHLVSRKLYKKLLKLIHMDFFVSEDNLNLVSKNDLQNIIKGMGDDIKIIRVRFLFFPLTLIVLKK